MNSSGVHGARALGRHLRALDVEERFICSAGSPGRSVPIAHSCPPSPVSPAVPPRCPRPRGCPACPGHGDGKEGPSQQPGTHPGSRSYLGPAIPPGSRLLSPELGFWSCGLYLSPPVRCLWSHPTPSPPSAGINCLKHFLDSRGGFCSLSPLFAIAWSPAWSQAPAGAANSGSPEGCPLPRRKDWGGSVPRAKNDLPGDAMTLPACPSAALHPPQAPPNLFFGVFIRVSL